MRVAIDYTSAMRQSAGIGRYTRGLVDALAAVDSQNQYVLLVARAGDTTEAGSWPANFVLRRNPVPERWLTALWHKLRVPVPGEWLVGSVDVYHSPDFTLPPLRAARGVVTVHDLSFMRYPQCADPGLRRYLERAVPRSVSRAALVLADSENTSRDLQTLLGVPPQKIAVVPAGVEPRFHRCTDRPELDAVRRRYRLPDRFVLSVGTLEPRKNLPLLISAFGELLRSTHVTHDLVIAGKPGWLFDETLARPKAEGIESRVHFPGFVDDEDLPALYSLADLFVFPSLYEGFGLPPLEAMACGVPAIVADNSSLPEAVGDAALLVPGEDAAALARAMAAVLGDSDLKDRLALAGPAQAARFTWRRAAERLLEVYQRAAVDWGTL